MLKSPIQQLQPFFNGDPLSVPYIHFCFNPPFKVYTCPSSRFPTIYASLSKKPRVRKKVRRDEDLCNDIREFMSRFGFPEDHLPSFKELSDHGRQDLAYVVRRRGYKLIKELLATSVKTKSLQNDLAGKDDEAAAVNMNLQDEVEDCAEAVHSSHESAITNDASDDLTIHSEFQLDSKSHTSVGIKTSLQEKVANNIKKELNMTEDSVFDILPKSVAEEGQASFDFEDTVELESSSGQPNAVNALKRSDALLSQQVELSSSKSNTREDCFSTDDGLSSADCNDYSDVESRKMENEVEISRLKFMLHQKDLELSELKEQIEKEKLALSLLQSRVETEIRTAQKVVSDKDAELHAAEEALSGLQEVHIQYRGAAESVEVAGSFNGWHQRIKLDPQSSSTPSIVDVMRRHDDSVNLPCIANFVRSFTLWRTVLWLYPGTYEIKFIVDGHWKTDPERESVTRGTIENNILRVNK